VVAAVEGYMVVILVVLPVLLQGLEVVVVTPLAHLAEVPHLVKVIMDQE